LVSLLVIMDKEDTRTLRAFSRLDHARYTTSARDGTVGVLDGSHVRSDWNWNARVGHQLAGKQLVSALLNRKRWIEDDYSHLLELSDYGDTAARDRISDSWNHCFALDWPAAVEDATSLLIDNHSQRQWVENPDCPTSLLRLLGETSRRVQPRAA
jgi:hypothetical protein